MVAVVAREICRAYVASIAFPVLRAFCAVRTSEVGILTDTDSFSLYFNAIPKGALFFVLTGIAGITRELCLVVVVAIKYFGKPVVVVVHYRCVYGGVTATKPN